MQIITDQTRKELKKHGSEGFPFLVSHERMSKYESGSFLWHWHPEIEITWVQKGRMRYQVNRSELLLKEGEALFGNANVLHAGHMEQEDCEYISVTFDARLIYGFHNSVIWQKYVEPVLRDFSLSHIHFDFSQEWHGDFVGMVKEIIRLGERKGPYYELELVGRLQEMWRLLLANYPSAAPSAAHERREYERIREIMAFLTENYMHEIRLKDVAAHIHLCPGECSRLFTRYMKLSLFGYLKEYRIERSLEYLAEETLSITEVAARVGFADPNYFSKAFREIQGCSPREYRRALR